LLRHGRLFRLAQAAILLGFAACAISESSSKGSKVSNSSVAGSLASWTKAPPDGCAVGSSGPTLNPRDSIRHARLSAIETLASDSLAVDIQTISGTGPDGTFEIAAQALSGSLENARIVALWAYVEPAGGFGSGPQLRQVYALACWPDAAARDVKGPNYPVWLLEPPRNDRQICAAGIAGPTWKKAEQKASALRDARLALAVALESQIEKRVYDDGHGVAKIARKIDPSASAIARAETAGELDREWYDEVGRGPIGLPNVLYGLACIEN
jgi:hypothetical protein